MALPEWKIGGEWKLPEQSGYSFSPSMGYLTTAKSSGLPRIRSNYKNQPQETTVTYLLMSEYEILCFFAFWYGVVGMGSKKCLIHLINNGVEEEFVCQPIDEPSFSEFTGWKASVTIKAVVTKNE